MTFSYDYEADALYIEITDSPVARTRQFDEGTMVDLNESGEVVGIEVLRPARAWPLEAIQASYELPDGDARILDSLWAQDPPRPYPFTRPPVFVS